MLNKICGWIIDKSNLAINRNGEPAAEDTHGLPTPRNALERRKRPIECLQDGHNIHRDDLAIKKSRMGDLIDSVKSAAEGVKNHSTNMATRMKKHVSPTLRSILPTSSDFPVGEPQPSTSSASWTGRQMVDRNSFDETFAAPSTTLDWKSSKSECLRIEKSMMGSKVCRRQVCMSSTQREMPKTNGHSLNTSSIPHKAQPSPRLGRPLSLRPHVTSSLLGGVGPTNSYCTNMYEKTFPIKVMQSPTHSTMSSRLHKNRPHCTAQECVHEEEKEMYRQLLALVSDGQSTFHHNGSSHTVLRSHRDFTSLFTSHSRLQVSSPAGSAAGGTSDGPSSPLSPRGVSSQSSSNLPSPVGASSKPETQMWSRDADFDSSRTAALAPAPSPSALHDSTSQDTQSSAHDGDSVIIVNDQKGKNQDSSNVSCFQAELWIKELTSMCESRARERQRRIKEQEALTALLLKQRLSDEAYRSPDVEVHVRVPLEKEVPLTPLVIEETKPLEEKPEFPELTEKMEAEVNRTLLKGGSPHEILSEGFGLSLTRKDLQTLSSLNWLNDEVINFYMNLLVERSKDPNLPSVNTFNTFFYPKLRSSGYSAVRRWTKKMDIFAKDLLLVPVHLGMHWCLSVVDFRKKSVMYFDSMGGRNDEACQMLFEYLQQESKDKKGKELDTSGWTLHSKKPSEIPQQMNGSDCGMFTCKYADYITKDKQITFTQKHMPYFRRRMVWEIVNHKLL